MNLFVDCGDGGQYPTTPEETLQLSNYDIDAVVTPIDVNALERLLTLSNYDKEKTKFLVDGFTQGFRLGYDGPKDVKICLNNLRFRVGNKFDLWDKIMKEVGEKRYAGPYNSIEEIPFPGDGAATGWIQSPCGLVEKSGNRTRLINHHSYPPGRSLNDGIDDDHSKVVYQDFQDAIKITMDLLNEDPEVEIFYSKLDGKNAFRVLGVHPFDRRWQVLKAENPMTRQMVYFVDLCVSFGNRASCFLYEAFSKALAHIYATKTGIKGVSYLDDALQVGVGQQTTNSYLNIFLQICREIRMPIADDKTVLATQVIVFLGLILNAKDRTIGIPEDKVTKALNQIEFFLAAKKVTVLDVQKLTGLLNFFCRAIVPGRSFTRRLYGSFVGAATKPHHHIKVNREMKLDLQMWKTFLLQDKAVLRPFVDFDSLTKFVEFPIFSDAAKSASLGYSTCFFSPDEQLIFYCFEQWDKNFLLSCDPSVQFLELMALAVGVILFLPTMRDQRVAIFCDNQVVIQMVNNGASSCPHCMILIRLITLATLTNNVRLQVRYIASEDNCFADLLSRMKHEQFVKKLPANVKRIRLQTPQQFKPHAKFFNVNF